ncbi:MAG: helix-turn-helix transcriptional regulator [Eubacteriales bacterium]
MHTLYSDGSASYKTLLFDISMLHNANLSEGYFTRIFKKQMMKTPIQYLNDLRLYHANHELAYGTSVTEVALANGFADVSYFIKQYKFKYGYTPRKTPVEGKC